MPTRGGLGANASGCSAETEGEATREQVGCAGHNIARPVSGQQDVTWRAVHPHNGGQQGGRNTYAWVLLPDVGQEEPVVGAGRQAAGNQAAMVGHPKEGER
jgi:hypothetical protein